MKISFFQIHSLYISAAVKASMQTTEYQTDGGMLGHKTYLYWYNIKLFVNTILHTLVYYKLISKMSALKDNMAFCVKLKF